MRRSAIVAAALLITGAVHAHAQDAALASIERLAASGRLTDARADLEQWNQAHPATADVPGAVRAHALLLSARLAVDPAAAEAGYLAVALGYPTTPHAPEALLRLGQGMVIAAEAGMRADGASRGAAFLERLVSDYPGTPHRATGVLWLIRATALGGRSDRACSLARDAITLGLDDDDVEDMVRVEFATHCEGELPDPDIRQSQNVVPASRAGDADGRYTVQSAALSDQRRANDLATALRAAGFDARIVHVRGSRLVRVRVGRFAYIADAEAYARRIRSASFEALVVGDANVEIAR